MGRPPIATRRLQRPCIVRSIEKGEMIRTVMEELEGQSVAARFEYVIVRDIAEVISQCRLESSVSYLRYYRKMHSTKPSKT